MKKATVLKDFPISYDGIRSIPAVMGQAIEVPESLVAGLSAEGFIELLPDEAPLDSTVTKVDEPIEEVKTENPTETATETATEEATEEAPAAGEETDPPVVETPPELGSVSAPKRRK